MDKIAIQILEMSYWEHFKKAKDLARYLPIDNPERVEIENTLIEILNKLNERRDAKDDIYK